MNECSIFFAEENRKINQPWRAKLFLRSPERNEDKHYNECGFKLEIAPLGLHFD